MDIERMFAQQIQVYSPSSIVAAGTIDAIVGSLIKVWYLLLYILYSVWVFSYILRIYMSLFDCVCILCMYLVLCKAYTWESEWFVLVYFTVLLMTYSCIYCVLLCILCISHIDGCERAYRAAETKKLGYIKLLQLLSQCYLPQTSKTYWLYIYDSLYIYMAL